MSKMLKSNTLRGQRPLLAMSLAVSIAAFSCTTDRTLGNGRPTGSNGVRTAPTSGVTSGSETAATPPPMMSSYSQPESVPVITTRFRPLSPDDAAAIMAANRPKVRVLGSVDFGPRPATPTVTATSVAAAQASPYTRVPVVAGDDADFVVAPVDQAEVDNLTANANIATSTPTSTAVSQPTSGAAASTRTATTIAPTTMTPTNAAMGVSPSVTQNAATQRASQSATLNSTMARQLRVVRPVPMQLPTATAPLRVISTGSGVTITNQQ